MLEMPWDPQAADVQTPVVERSGLSYRVGRSLAEVLECWQLVYQSYTRDGLIDPNPFGVHTTKYAIGPRTSVAMAVLKGSIVGTLSSYGDGPEGLPLDVTYRAEIESLRRAGRRPMEVGLFADRRVQVSRSVESLLELMRYAFYFALDLSADDVIVGVHPRHAPFYMRLFGFEQLGTRRTYPMVKDRPVVLLKFDMNRQPATDSLPKGLAYLVQHPLSRAEFKDRYLFDEPAVADSPIGQFVSSQAASHAA